jgi:hypothetical protein
MTRSAFRLEVAQAKQNKPSLIVKDLAPFGVGIVTTNGIYKSLLRRGVFKWLKVRRDLIRLKDIWRDEIRLSHQRPNIPKEQGYRKALVKCREEVRCLCHSPRWTVPLEDRPARRWFCKQAP